MLASKVPEASCGCLTVIALRWGGPGTVGSDRCNPRTSAAALLAVIAPCTPATIRNRPEKVVDLTDLFRRGAMITTARQLSSLTRAQLEEANLRLTPGDISWYVIT